MAFLNPTASMFLRVFSEQRSLQRPVPNGSCARLSNFQYVNRPKIRCFALMLWSARATYSSMLPPVLAAFTKLLVGEVLFGSGRYLSKNWAVGLIRVVGMTFPAKAVRVQGIVAETGHVGTTDRGSYMGAMPGAEKSPVRSAALGTLVENTVPVRKRNAS